MASELGRVAHAALRSASLFRPSISHSAPSRFPFQHTAAPAVVAVTPLYQRHARPYSTPSWPASPPPRQPTTEVEVKKPKMDKYYNPSNKPSSSSSSSSYSESSPYGSEPTYNDIVDDVTLEMDLEIDELRRKKPDNKLGVGEAEPPPVPEPTMRLSARLGRTVHVTGSVDVARSFRLLSMQIAQNKVRRESLAQRFHERPGLKRKRLKSERWQRRFKMGFKETVRRVRELTKQGW